MVKKKRKPNEPQVCQICNTELPLGFGTHLHRCHGITREEYDRTFLGLPVERRRSPKICLECGAIFPHGFGTHLSRVHGITLRDYKEKHLARYCACGCGTPVKPGNKYILGHSNKKFTPADDYLIMEAYLSQPRGRVRTFPDELLDRFTRHQITHRARKLGLTTTVDTPIIVRHLSREDAAYVAGLFDGDGNILGDCITFQITEGHEDSLRRCVKVIGAGQVVPVKYKEAWRYQLNGERNISFLAKQIEPYSVIKKDILATASRHFEESESYYEQTSFFMPQQDDEPDRAKVEAE